ncbi:type II secretion system F family protein [Temperatibacter marinus]|uniref:Type II secretion system F family protein n=1 Tax=Temperatibacter marinus TaxID=1456591 RepID=A0AA52EHK1_9PROT|nr:type II secretion system F family protein [Temperatibacter marinus]WND02644.1 type II secretion system F family protein [Temperatibacter marinus]
MEALSTSLGIPLAELLSYVAGLAAAVVLFSIYASGLVSDPMRGRLKGLEERKDALKSGLVTSKKRQSNIKRTDGVSSLRSIAEKLKLLQNEQTQKITQTLAQAGFRSKDSLVIYQFSRLVMPILFGLIAVILFYGVGVMDGWAKFYPLLSVAFVFLGLKAPDIYVSNVKSKRVSAIRMALPDALDLLVVCAEAGLTLDAAMKRVATELAKASPELAEEFQIAAIELGFLPDRRQALINLSERVDVPALRGVVTTLVQSEKYGTPLATSLRVLSAEFRNERLMLAEEKAAKLPATLTVPLILFILPVLFIVLMGPATCQMVDNFINRA